MFNCLIQKIKKQESVRATSGLVLSILAALLFAACSGQNAPSSATNNSSSWLREGSITIARPLPAPLELKSQNMLGFIPTTDFDDVWLEIDTSKRTLKLMQGKQALHTVKEAETSRLEPGAYHLAHKQRHAAWYAPDNYFINRKLPVPAAGHPDRYLRGALGDYVLFVDEDTHLHNGPVWADEVGGIRLDENEIARLYYQLQVGSPIMVH